MRRPGCLALLLAIGIAGVAKAQAPRSSSLSWTRLPGAEECIASRPLAEAVEARLGRSVFVSAAQGDVAVEGRIQPGPNGKGWRAVLGVTNPEGKVLGTRELASEESSCRALDDQLTLVIALLIDPEAALRAPSSPPTTAPPPPAPPPKVIIQKETVTVPVPVVVSQKLPPPAWRVGAEVGPVIALGLLPGVAYGLGARVAVDPPWRWPLLLEGSLWSEAEAEKQGGVARFRLALAGLALCPLHSEVKRARAMVCAAGQLGSLRMRSADYEINREQEQLAAQVGILGRGVVRIVGPLIAAGALTLAAPLVRDRFFVRVADGTTPEVYQMAPVTAGFALSLGVELP